jgi:hypothetical protein
MSIMDASITGASDLEVGMKHLKYWMINKTTSHEAHDKRKLLDYKRNTIEAPRQV